MVVGLVLLPASFTFATNVGRELTDRENAAFIVRDEWTAWVKGFTASLSELDKNATSRIYTNMDYYDMQYRFTEKYKKVPEYLDEDGKPTQKLKDLIKEKRKELNGAKARDGFLAFTSTQNGSRISYTINGSLPNLNIGYSYDMISWTKWDGSSINLDNNETIYVWNKSNTLSLDNHNGLYFDMSGAINASGNVNSLINFREDVPDYSFFGLFLECRNLKQAPELPATTVGNYAYTYMFSGCRGLLSAPELPATNIGNYCYAGMFNGCQNMTSAPVILPAKILKENCYASMFKGCEALTTAPLLPATTLVNNCYNRIFDGCTNLRYIELSYKGILDSAYFNNWVNNVADSGEILYDGPTATFGASAIPKDDTNRWIITQSPTELRFLANEASTIKYVINGNVAPRISYSYDRTTWTDWDANTVINLATNENIYVKNSTLNLSTGTNNYVQFVMTGSLSGGGDISSMVNYNSVRRYCFYRLFKDCTSLVSSPILPATEVVEACYSEMFKGCTNLAAAPALPATVLADSCYKNMFDGCTSLQVAPELPATTLMAECYFSMFKGCTNLTTAPTTLPATTLSYSCYECMFDGCTNLTTVPTTLPATTLRNYCYRYMFRNCENLAQAPEILATTLERECCYAMFLGCKNLTTAPTTLPATTLSYGCYCCMFWDCENLTTAPTLPATTLASHCYEYMFNGCKHLQVAPELPATTLEDSCYRYMFFNCENLTQAPELPATTLVVNSYAAMFSGCTSLTTAPELPATSLVTGCYHNLFDGCTNLNFINIGWTGDFGLSCFSNWVRGVADTGTFVYKGTHTSNFGSSYIPKDSAHKWEIKEHAYLVFEALEDNSKINIQAHNGANISGVQVSSDEINWTTWGTTVKTLNSGEKIYVRNTNNTLSTSYDDYVNFTMSSGSFKSYGNIYALINNSALTNYCFESLFGGCVNLKVAPELPATTLAPYCYDGMFYMCTGLTKAPELPATTLADSCYKNMFNKCSNLNYIKIGYTGDIMGISFNNWVEQVADSGTFVYKGTYRDYGASAIPKDDTHKWIVLDSEYLKFTAKANNSSVAYSKTGTVDTSGIQISTDEVNWTAWNGSARTLNNNDVLYVRNTNSTLSIGVFRYMKFVMTGTIAASGNVNAMINNSNLTNYCFNQLFSGCTSLTTAPVLPSNVLASYCYANMFEGTGLTVAPELPSTSLSEGCYSRMFLGCTSLTRAPYLPAPNTLQSECYFRMFSGCTSLNYVKIGWTGHLDSTSFSWWLENVAPTGTLVYNNVSGYTVPSGSSGKPAGWTLLASD